MNMDRVLCVLLLVSGVACAQTRPGNAAAALVEAQACADPGASRAAQQIVDTWIAGYNGGDSARVAALYTEDAYYLTQHYVTGILHGRANIQAYVQRGVDAGYHIDSIRILHVGCAGDLMYVITRYESTNAGQKAIGVNLVVASRTPGGWRIAAHEAAVPDPATAVQQLNRPGSH